MELDVRTNELFMEILNHPNETSGSLGKRLGLTRAQINYSFKKLNEYLADLQLEAIHRTPNGHFVVPRTVNEQFNDLHQRKQIDIYLAPEERMYLITLMLLSKTDFLSMNHFIVELNVSKNTVVRDLKELGALLAKQGFKLEYLRSKGYRIKATEWQRRQLLLETINQIYLFDTDGTLLLQFADINEASLANYQAKVEAVEQSLNIRYSDNNIKNLPVFTLLLHRRVKRKKTIRYDVELDFSELQETQEYNVIKEIFFDGALATADFNDVIYFTLLFLSTNLTQMDILSAKELRQLELAVTKVIQNFEKTAHVIIVDKEALLQRVMIHMRPAYYRIKYQMHLNEVDIERQKNMGVSSVFYLVKQSLEPLEQFFSKQLPETEIFYLALFFGGHLLEHESVLAKEERKTAIIVCTNGISVSLMLERNLTGLFPEIDFIATLSAREFYEKNIEAEYVFSSVPLETDKRFYLVKDFLTDEGKLQLRKQVMNDTLVGMDDFALAEKIVKKVKKNTKVLDEEALFLDVLHVLKENVAKNEKIKDHVIHFDQLIPSKSILIEENQVTWHDALDALSQPLISEKIITPQYLTALKQEMAEIPPYMVFRNRLALPHTEPEKGALGVAMSFGIFKEGLVTETGERIHIVVLLSSNDKEKHIDALLELMDLSGRDDYISKLVECQTAAQAYKILHSYRINYWG
jgi:transcriptional antiterminator/mannitol/fructose-specific phosphotransferase system IIA component (Ntr-type)